jgi:hypothetical protein
VLVAVRLFTPAQFLAETDKFVFASTSAFHLARFRTGELLTNSQTPPLPKFNPSAREFPAFDAGGEHNLLFGHSEGRLWAWDSRSGKTCTSDVLYSESGALSPDGAVVAGARDNSIFAPGQSRDEVLLSNTQGMVESCGFAANTPRS